MIKECCGTPLLLRDIGVFVVCPTCRTPYVLRQDGTVGQTDPLPVRR